MPRLAPSSRPAAATYWKRRFIALATGLSALALLTWAMSSALGSAAPGSHNGATRTGHRSLTRSSASPAQTATSPTASTSLPTASGSASPSGRASPSSHPSASSHPSPASQPTGIATNSSARPCPANAVVLSLFSSQTSYSSRQQPQLAIDVVSTASQTCTFNIGSRHLWLQIKNGHQQVWSSAECAEGQASLVTNLRRGVPTVVSIVWNEHVSSPSCPVPGAAAGSGTYTAVASDGSDSSNVVEFHTAG